MNEQITGDHRVMPIELGQFVKNKSLAPDEQHLVELAWEVADLAYCIQSDFHVGAALIATNKTGDSRVFTGCNIMNLSMPATICAERSAVFNAITAGFTKINALAAVCKNIPGGFPCGACRQVLREFGLGATLLIICDREKNVRRLTIDELLPAPKSPPVSWDSLDEPERELLEQCFDLIGRAYVPYSRQARGAALLARNPQQISAVFPGTQIDNASYGVSISAERSAMASAVTAGFQHFETLAVRGDDPIDGEDLQFLREFGGLSARLLIAGRDRSVIRSSLSELLPDSFGPESVE